jgi:hypothetical protein
MANYLTITGANVFVDASGAPLADGTLVIAPTSSFRTGDNKQATVTKVQRSITNGSCDSAIQLANPANTSPANIGYTFTITDLGSGSSTVIENVLIADAGDGTWNIGALNTGAYQKAIPVTVVTGPAGPAGDVNGPQLAEIASRINNINLLNPAKVTTGALLNYQTGALNTFGESNFYATDYFPVPPGGKLYSNAGTVFPGNPFGWAFYDVAKAFISGVPGVAANTAVNVPSNAVYARACANSDGLAVAATMIGAVPIPTYFVPFGVSLATDNVVASQLTDYAKGLGLANNLFLASRAVANAALYKNGGLLNISGWFATDFMAVLPSDFLICSQQVFSGGGDYGWQFFDTAKTYLSGTSGGNAGIPVATPAGAAYARCSFKLSDGASLSNVQVYQGNSIPAVSSISSAQIAALVQASNPNGNLYNPATATSGAVIKPSGEIIAGVGAQFMLTDFLLVIPGGSVISPSNTNIGPGDGTYGWSFYDINKGYISGAPGVAANVHVSVPAGAFFARVSVNVDPNGDAQGPRVRIYNGTVSSGRLAGKVWRSVGDSITAKEGGVFQAYVCAVTGMSISSQDARGGRQTNQIFEMYQVSGSPTAMGDPVNGHSTGGIINTSLPQAAGDGSVSSGAVQINQPGPWTTGTTLAQDLTNVDIVTIFLGTNDGSIISPLGSLSDTASTASYYGYLRNAIEGYLKAKPGIRLVWIGPYQNTHSGSNTAAIVAAQQAVCAAYSVSYINLFANGGINPLTYGAFLQGDNIHPSLYGSVNVLGRMLEGFLRQIY